MARFKSLNAFYCLPADGLDVGHAFTSLTDHFTSPLEAPYYVSQSLLWSMTA